MTQAQMSERPWGHPTSQQPRQEDGGHRQEGGNTLNPSQCALGFPEHRSQPQPLAHQRADTSPLPPTTPSWEYLLPRPSLHPVSLQHAPPRILSRTESHTNNTASLHFPCPNLRDPSCVLPLNPCIDPFYPIASPMRYP